MCLSKKGETDEAKNMSGCWQFPFRFMQIEHSSLYCPVISWPSPVVVSTTPLVSLSNILLAWICVRRVYFSCCIFNSGLCMCPQTPFKPSFNLTEKSKTKMSMLEFLMSMWPFFLLFIESILYCLITALSLMPKALKVLMLGFVKYSCMWQMQLCNDEC